MPSALKRMQTATVLKAGIKVPFRKRLRVFTEDRRVEGFIMFVVLLYFLVICLDFTVPELVKLSEGSYTVNYQNFIISWTRSFWVIDVTFLSIFVLEIGMRLYAWGRDYLKDAFNVADMIIVFSSFALTFVTMEFTMMTCLDFSRIECTGAESGFESTRGILRVFRIVRIFRIVIIVNKIKRSRENAQILRKKAKYKRQGSPVERVVEILQRLRLRAESGADRDNLAFIMDAIISDQLYTVNVSAAETSGMTTEMSAFLLEGGAQTNKGPKGPVGVRKVIAKAGTVALTVGGNKSPKKSKEKGDDADGQGGKNADGSGYEPPEPGDEPEEGGKATSIVRRASAAGLRNELEWVETLQIGPDVRGAMNDVDSWEFSVFELDKISNQHPVLLLVLEMVQRFDLQSALPINTENLVRLLLRVEAGYKTVPFHNHVHAADVIHGTAYFLSEEVVARHVSPLDIYCLILSAALHDFSHPGYNNAFLVASRHETAILYNDSSVLENFHISSSWRLMLEEDLNPFAGFSDEQYQEARQTMVYAILGTDMKYHFDHLTKFKTRMSAGAFEDPDRKDVRLLLAMCLHSADVSNPAKKWDLTQEWAARVMEEFFQQGEEEARAGLPVSPFMDRKKTDIGKCQAGFISILIKPFFDEWTNFLGDASRHIFTNIEDNIKVWSEQGEAALGTRAQQLHEGPPPIKK